MIATAVIAFREFLEAFLIVGVFLGISKKMKLKKEGEIWLAALAGVTISLVLAVATYAFGDAARTILTEDRAELLGNYLLLFSGFFLAYVVVSLHNKLSEGKNTIIKQAKLKLEKRMFDFSLFATIIFLVFREGFEIALFTASTSLFSVFLQNVIGLLIGFVIAAIIGACAFVAYIKFSIKKVFRVTEYMIVLLGASMVQVGITELLEKQCNFHLANIASFHLHFLPDEYSLVGKFLRTFTGVDGEFSLPRLLIMIMYISAMYTILTYKKVAVTKG